MNSDSGFSASLLDARDSVPLLQCLFEQSRDAIIVFDPADMTVIDANRAATSISESLQSEPQGQRLLDLFDADQSPEVRQWLGARSSGQPMASAKPLMVKLAGGHGVITHATVHYFDARSGDRGVLVMEIDRPRIPHSEATIPSDTENDLDDAVAGSGSTEDEAALAGATSQPVIEDRVISAAPLGIVIADATQHDLPIVFCNPEFENMTGYSMSDILGRNCRFLQGNDRTQPGVEKLRQAVVHQQHCTAVLRNYRKDGRMFWCEVSVSPLRDSEGRVTHFIGIQCDITQRVELNRRLEESQRALENAQSRACLGSWEYCPASGKTTWSREMYRLYRHDRSLGAPQEVERFALLLHPDDRRAVIERHRQILESDRPVANLDLRTNPELGPMRWLDSSASRIADQSAGGFHIVGTVLDVTQRKQAELALRESEHRFRTLCQHSAMGIFLADVAGHCTYINESGCAIVGQTRQQVSGEGWSDALHPDDQQRIIDQWRQYVREGGVLDMECRFVHRDGTVVWACIHSSEHRNDEGQLVGYVGSFIDITSQKVAREKLQQSERRYRVLVEHAPEAIVVLDPQTERFVDFNAKALTLFDCDAETLYQSGPGDFSPDKQPDGRDSAEVARAYVEQALAGEHPVFEWLHRDSSGTGVPCEIRLLRFDLGAQSLVRGSITDITDRKRAEQQLRMTRFALETNDDAMFVVDRDARFVDVNSAACSQLGYSRQELMQMTVNDIDPEYPPTVWRDHWPKIKQSGRLVFETTHATSQGTLFPVEVSVSFFEFGGNEYAFAFVRDIRDRKAVEEQLRYTKIAIDTNRGVITQVDSRGAFIYVNDAACDHFGYSRDELLTMHVWDVDLQWQRESWNDGWSALQRAGSTAVETVNRMKDGTLRHVEVTTNHFIVDGEEYLFAHAVDITQRKRTEARLRERESQLAHVSRLSTMGEMVAGIAHELNQPLYSIVNFSKAIGNVIKSPTAESLAQIEAWNEQVCDAATRAGHIIHRMRGFVQRESTCSVTDLSEIIGDALELVRHESERAGITLKFDRTVSEAEVRIDRVQIQQVLVNLLVNAIEAIAQHDCEIREIVVAASRCDDVMQVTVADSGPGIAWQDDRRMFAAFETSKKGGMGMGLAISNTIIESFGGRLWSDANDAGGATFCFTLPTSNSEVRDDS